MGSIEAASTVGRERRSAGRSMVSPARVLRILVALLCCLVLGAAPAARVLLAEDFTGPDGPFVSQSAFYGSPDGGVQENPDWFAESGELVRRAGKGRTQSEVFRMWTRRTDLAFPTVSMDVRFHGWTGGDQPWHGINLWLNETLCSPAPTCSRVDDRGGVSGYALDFVNRDGTVTVLKKVAGDTRERWPEGATSFVQGGTYYELASAEWSPVHGRSYRFGAQALDLGRGRTLLRTSVDGRVLLEVVDDGSVGGPALSGGGRVGLRGDFADLEVDDLRITR